VTIAATRTRELDINTIIARAMQLAGLMNPQQSTSDPTFAPYRQMALDFLETICKETQAEAVIERHVVLQTATVTASNATVTLATSAMAMLGDAMFTQTGDTIAVPVTLIDIATYQAIPDKTTTSDYPSLGYFNRQPTPTITLWPVPDTGGTLSVQSHILAADVSDATNTLDFERHWTGFFMWELAYWMSTSGTMPIADRMALRAEARNRKEVASSYSHSLLPKQIRFGHKTPWSGW
jgi:hypothetical protein